MKKLLLFHLIKLIGTKNIRKFLIKQKNIIKLRRADDFNKAILLALIIAFFVNLIDFVKDLTSETSSWKIGLFFIVVIGLAISIFANKRIDSESAVEIREKKKHNSRKEAFKIIDKYRTLG